MSRPKACPCRTMCFKYALYLSSQLLFTYKECSQSSRGRVWLGMGSYPKTFFQGKRNAFERVYRIAMGSDCKHAEDAPSVCRCRFILVDSQHFAHRVSTLPSWCAACILFDIRTICLCVRAYYISFVVRTGNVKAC